MADVTISKIETFTGNSFNYTPASGTDTCLVVVGQNNQDFDDPLDASFDGSPATLVTRATLNNGGSFDTPTDIYLLANPGTSAINVTSSFDDDNLWTCMTLANVHQTTPVKTGEDSDNTATSTTTISDSLTTTVDGSMIIAALGEGGDGIAPASYGSGQTERSSQTQTFSALAVTSEVKSTAGAETSSGTWSATRSSLFLATAAFQPANAGDTVVTATTVTLTLTPTNAIVVVPATLDDFQYLSLRNDVDTSSLPHAGTNLDADWDTEISKVGTGLSETGGVITVTDAGKYLALASERFNVTGTTNNDRIEAQSRFLVSGSPVIYGPGQGYIRKANGSQDCAPYSAAILSLGASATVATRFYRTDDSTIDAPPTRVPDTGGFSLLKLGDAWDYGRYRYNGNQDMPGTANVWTDLLLDTTDEQDSNFSLSSNAITVTTAGRYLITYSAVLTNSSTTARSDYALRLELNNTAEIVGSRTYTFVRGSDSCQDGAVSWGGIVELSASDVVRLQAWIEGTSTTGGIQNLNIQMVLLPDHAETIIIEATTGDYNTAATDFAWDTLEQIDTAAFTHTAGNTNIDVDVADDYLAFTSLWADDDAATRCVPAVQFAVNNIVQQNGINSAFHRNSNPSLASGLTLGSILSGLSANDSIEVHNDRLGTISTSILNESGQFSILRLGSVFVEATGNTEVTATSATLTLTPANTTVVVETDTSVVASTISLTLTPTNAVIVVEIDHEITATSATLTLTPAAGTVVVETDTPVIAGTKTLTITPTNTIVLVEQDHEITATSATLTLTPTNSIVVVETDTIITANNKTLTLSPTNTTIVIESDVSVIATAAALTLTPTNAAIVVEVDHIITANSAILTISPTSAAVVVETDVTVVANPVSLTLTPTDAVVVVETNVEVVATTVALTLTPTNAAVSIGSDVNVNATSAVLTLAPTNAVVVVEQDHIITATSATLVLSQTNATVVVEQDTSIISQTAILTLSPTNAIVVVETNVNVTANSTTLTLTPSNATILIESDTSVVTVPVPLILTPTNPTVFVEKDTLITANEAVLALTPTNAVVVVETDTIVIAGEAVLTLTPTNAAITIETDTSVIATTTTLTLVPTNATILIEVDHIVTSVPKELTLVPANATIVIETDVAVTATPAILTVTPTNAVVVDETQASLGVIEKVVPFSNTPAMSYQSNTKQISYESNTEIIIQSNTTPITRESNTKNIQIFSNN